jgi:hypothetical protein
MINKLTRMLWWCAGARIDILEKEECKSDHAKFFGIGGTILFTAMMASFAGGYAFFTAFKEPIYAEVTQKINVAQPSIISSDSTDVNTSVFTGFDSNQINDMVSSNSEIIGHSTSSILLSIFFGAFWGLLIFNLDRYIVATIKDDGKPSISRGEIINASPRLLMAVLLGFVIATPLELKIFEPEIKTVVERLKIDKVKGLIAQDSTFIKDLNEAKQELTALKNDTEKYEDKKDDIISGKKTTYDDQIKDILDKKEDADSKKKKLENTNKNLKNELEKLIEGNTDNSKLKGQIKTNSGDIKDYAKEIEGYNKSKDSLMKLKATYFGTELENFTASITENLNTKVSLNEKIKNLENIKNDKLKHYESVMKNYNGFAAHLEAMSILTAEKSAIFWAKWLITILFIFIEVAPVLFKLMVEAGPYDEILQRQKYEAMVKQKLAVSMLNDEINTTLIISAQKNKTRLEVELKANDELMQTIALSQAEIGKKAVDKWKEIELEKLDHSLNNIVNATSISNEEPPKS